ncbi:MAG: fibronectin type III domain-containing protein [Eubacteriales bacterium]|nr:fibronectin type III domain-containing protein [Eubacteriales bacterium]
MNGNKRKLIIALVVLAMCVSTAGVTCADAASRPAKPKFKMMKRTKKTATLKVKNSKGVTGYRIYLKTGKKGKWKLHDFALHSSKIKLTKLKPNKVYYVKLKAWKTKGHSVRLSRYSKTIKIGKYQSGQKKPTASPMPTPSVSPIPDGGPATEGALTVTQ